MIAGRLHPDLRPYRCSKAATSRNSPSHERSHHGPRPHLPDSAGIRPPHRPRESDGRRQWRDGRQCLQRRLPPPAIIAARKRRSITAPARRSTSSNSTNSRDAKAGKLSGGQKKLLELGRALMRNPRIILLDEIGAGINRTLLGRASPRRSPVLNVERGLTFCLIEHDLDYVSAPVQRCHRHGAGRGADARHRRAKCASDERVIEAYFGGGKYEERRMSALLSIRGLTAGYGGVPVIDGHRSRRRRRRQSPSSSAPTAPASRHCSNRSSR